MEHLIPVSHLPQLSETVFPKLWVLAGVLGPKMGKFYGTSDSRFPFT